MPIRCRICYRNKNQSRPFYNCVIAVKPNELVKQQNYWKDVQKINNINVQIVFKIKMKCVSENKLRKCNTQQSAI